MGYTKGPWHVQIGEGEGPMANGYIASIGIWSQVRLDAAMADDENEDADDDKWVSGIWGKLTDVDVGNANLIAAAPELLEALVAASEYLDYHNIPVEIAMLVDFAIAKAKGETK